MGHMEIVGLRGSRRQTCDLGSDMQLGRESYHEACVLLHLALGLGVKPQDLLLKVRESAGRALALHKMPAVVRSATRISSQAHRDGPQSTDMLRFIGHYIGKTVVLCYVHTPVGPRAVLYKPIHVEITDVVELFMWAGHCILLLPPEGSRRLSWADAQVHLAGLSRVMKVDQAWCMDFGDGFAVHSKSW